jgi:hypothetical protein
VLARLNGLDSITTTFLSSDGTQLLLQGSGGASRDEVLAACAEGLADSKLRPDPLSTDDAMSAWSVREGEAWLDHSELWKLSWREAETFADRVLVALVEEHGEGARALRPLLVESFFEGVRPEDRSGPTPSHWEKGASTDLRRSKLIEEARKHLSEGQVARVAELLADGERIRALLRPKAQAQ